MPDHGLSDRQLEIIRSVLAPYHDRIERVGLFGSRAGGRPRRNSDIDMVLYGDVSEALVDRLWTLFDESLLDVNVDVTAYEHIAYPPLKEHIDAAMQPLFEKSDLP